MTSISSGSGATVVVVAKVVVVAAVCDVVQPATIISTAHAAKSFFMVFILSRNSTGD
jgi:hypothetical protein